MLKTVLPFFWNAKISVDRIIFINGTRPLMLPREKVIWSRKCTPTMAVAATPPHEKVRNKTARIRVLLDVRRTLICHSPTFFVISLINPRIFTNLTVVWSCLLSVPCALSGFSLRAPHRGVLCSRESHKNSNQMPLGPI